ncbi:hypothetical protein BC941DRAFT_356064 [Chlamydoabsidia padenii]|nr:hypothetical protein BC941DRAFT_356064 [Chlamydoabsidia padenii]
MPPSSPNALLTSLKDFTKCNDVLATSVKQTILEPFQPDLESLKRRTTPPPTRQEFKTKAKVLAPLAMRIVNQNIETLKRFKEWRHDNNYNNNNPEPARHINTIKHCLIDTSFYATAALKHMKAYAPLKPLDIEKTTSNLIGKLVDLGEWARALEELRKFRIHLASIERIQLDKNLTLNLTTEYPNHQQTMGSLIGHQQQQQQSSEVTVVLVGGRPSSMTSWEEDMILKYADLFTFPLDPKTNDRSIILLVLAYQMSVIRSWCDINDGVMVKYLSILLDRPGNFIDWCKHLMMYDAVLAKKQFDLLQRHLTKTVKKQIAFGKYDNILWNLYSLTSFFFLFFL